MCGATIPIYRNARESSKRFLTWTFVVRRNLKPWPSPGSCLRSRRKCIESTWLFSIRRPIKKRKSSSKADLSELHSRLAAKERCKHLEMAVEEDVYGSARRDVPASICIVSCNFVFTSESLLYLEESFERKKDHPDLRQMRDATEYSSLPFSSRFLEKSACKSHFIHDEILAFHSNLIQEVLETTPVFTTVKK